MHTYTCDTERLFCSECRKTIKIGEEFAVVTSPSKPYKDCCTKCAEVRVETERHCWIDETLNRKQQEAADR